MSGNLKLFPFDIQVLAFNRPEYLEECLKALQVQTLPIDPKRIFFWQDGYSGSLDEYRGMPDKTGKSLELIKRYFPESEVFVSQKNLGIGLSFKAAEENSFVLHDNEWGFFLEEDNILQDFYLKVILQLVYNFQEYEEIVQLDAFGDYKNQIGSDYFIPMHSWAFALRAKHYFERRDLLSGYEEILRDCSYFRRDTNKIYKYFANYGLKPFGTSQDYIKRILMSYFKRIALTTNFSGAKNIGVFGEHFNYQAYEQLGYKNQRTTVELQPLPPINEKTVSSLLWNQLGYLSAEFEIQKSRLQSERDGLLAERDGLLAERDGLLNSNIWRITKPYRLVRSKLLQRVQTKLSIANPVGKYAFGFDLDSFEKLRLEDLVDRSLLDSKLDLVHLDLTREWFSEVVSEIRFKEVNFFVWMNLLKEKPKLHSKQFQYYAILEKAWEIASGSRIKPKAIGFGVGKEPIPAALAKIGYSVTATDYLDGEIASEWKATGQLIKSLNDLNNRGIASKEQFAENFKFLNMDMNAIPSQLYNSFDFVWSTCALGHIGSYQKGLDFISRSGKLLKSGGWAVHSTELDLSGQAERFETPNLNLYKLEDLIDLVKRLENEGYEVRPILTNSWQNKSERYVASEPWGDKPHLRINVLGREIVSIVIIFRRR